MAEVMAADLFAPVSGIVGRALARGVIRAAGLDPFGVTLPEAAAARDGAGLREAVAAYPIGDGVPWVTWWAEVLAEGARLGGEAADAVLDG
jgi:hypothetical protein